MKELILQESRTLDQALLSGMRIFSNGCNFRLIKELDDNYYLEYGCCGVLINLVTGDERLIYNWFSKTEVEMRKLSGVVSRETITELLERDPCERCGGVIFRMKPE